MLAIGLFRPPRPTMKEWAYTPEDAAKDSAFGTAGVLLLTAGFIGQCLPDIGIRVVASTHATRIAVGAVLACAVIFAYAAYGIAFVIVFERRMHHAREDEPKLTPPWRWTPTCPRFWTFSITKRDGTEALIPSLRRARP